MSESSYAEKFEHDFEKLFQQVTRLCENQEFHKVSEIGREIQKTHNPSEFGIKTKRFQLFLVFADVEHLLGNPILSKNILDCIEDQDMGVVAKGTITREVPQYEYPKSTMELIGNLLGGSYGKPKGYKTQHQKEAYVNKSQLKIIELKILNDISLNNLTSAFLSIQKLSKELGKLKGSVFFDDITTLQLSVSKLTEEYRRKLLLNDVTTKYEFKNESQDFNLDLITPYFNYSQDELYGILGSYVTTSTRRHCNAIQSQINKLSKGEDVLLLKSGNELTPDEQRLNMAKKQEDISFGKELWDAMKSSMYDTLCDPKSRPGRILFDKDQMVKLVISSLTIIGVTANPVLGSISALVFMWGLDTVCKVAEKRINSGK